MADSVQVAFEGERDLVAAFRELHNDMGRKYLMRAVRKGATVLKTIIVANAPEDTGNLRRNIRVGTRKTKATVRARVLINTNKRPKKGEKSSSRNAFYWPFVERGHRVRTGSAWGPKATSGQYLRKAGRKSGGYAGTTTMVKGQKFIERSWKTWNRNAVQMAINEFEKTIERVAAKQRRGKR